MLIKFASIYVISMRNLCHLHHPVAPLAHLPYAIWVGRGLESPKLLISLVSSAVSGRFCRESALVARQHILQWPIWRIF